VETLGPEVILVGALPNGVEISARMGRDYQARIGTKERLAVDVEELHLFDAETTRAIPRPKTGAAGHDA